ncbi:MAG: hypothetical protein GY944_14165 [bacterium]|nr:hypothetical protein [bacterium]
MKAPRRAGVGTQTNSNVAPGETWTLTYTMSQTLPISDPSNPAIGIYNDPRINPTISFSDAYSAPVSSVPGMTSRSANGIVYVLNAVGESPEFHAGLVQSTFFFRHSLSQQSVSCEASRRTR